MKLASALILVLLLVAACGGPGEAPATAEPAAAPPEVEKPADETHRLPKENRVKAEVVDNHLLGKEFLPGGNLAEYQKDKKTYQQFLIDAGSNARATSLMMKYKNELKEPKFLAQFGGYFGKDGEQPVLLFTLQNYLAGIVGLPQEEADVAARELAARLH
jgi:hypothetical protein